MPDNTFFDDFDIFADVKLNDADDVTNSKSEPEPEVVAPKAAEPEPKPSATETEQCEAATETCTATAEQCTATAEATPEPAETTTKAEAAAPAVDLTELYGMIERNTDRTDAFSSKLAHLSQSIETMNQQVTRLAAYDTAVETLKRSFAANQVSENNLYKEVETYKKGMYFTYVKPFLMFMIEMLCDLKNSKAQYTDDKEAFIAENGENIYEEICSLHDFYINSFESQLRIQGVQIIAYELGSEYVPIQQHIAKTIPTDDPALNSTLAKIYCDCYMYEDKILRPAKVHVYKHA